MSSTLPHHDHDSNSGSAAAAGVLDAAVLQSLKDLGGEDDPGLFFELIDLFLQDAPQRMNEIRRGLEQGDIHLLERAAHTLKSSSANIGALSLSTLCRRMEEQARKHENAGLAELYDSSRQLWPHVEAALRAAKS
ncbi:MAG: Hpt domain-containing protein [Planctomycetes bacterium]|nr:Hpt domain-containing protein [Planctomycetota bacterium]